MNAQNLQPQKYKIKTTERAKELGRLGGLSRSPKKKWAARLRDMKKKGLTDENYKRIVAWMEEPESSAMDIFIYLESIKKHCNNAGQMNNVAQSQISLMKAHHGEKTSPQINIQINNITDKELAIKRLLNEDNSETISDDT